MAEKRLICFYTFIHVFHFSDGIGRTGTYCLLDMVLNRMAKGAKEIDIAATLEHIRDQRNGAVAIKQQFQFVLQAVAEEVRTINKYIINYLLPLGNIDCFYFILFSMCLWPPQLEIQHLIYDDFLHHKHPHIGKCIQSIIFRYPYLFIYLMKY